MRKNNELKPFQRKCDAVSRPELRKNNERERPSDLKDRDALWMGRERPFRLDDERMPT
jgi:hypothetical protein